MYLDPLCAIAATTKTDLATRVHNLPPELFTMIHDYAFSLDTTSTTSSPLEISPDHRVPAIMQADTQSRAQLAKQLYAPAAHHQPIHIANHELAARWLCSLPQEHLALLREVRVGSGLPEAAQMLDSHNYLAKMQWGFIMHALRTQGLEIADGVLHFKVSSPVEGEKKGAARERVWSNEVS